MAEFTFNERTHFYEADEGLHTIRIDADIFMTELDKMKADGFTEPEALDELFRVDTWYNKLPCPGVYIDGVEQTDDGAFLHEDRRRVIEPVLQECRYCHQMHQAEHIEQCSLKPKH